MPVPGVGCLFVMYLAVDVYAGVRRHLPTTANPMKYRSVSSAQDVGKNLQVLVTTLFIGPAVDAVHTVGVCRPCMLGLRCKNL